MLKLRTRAIAMTIAVGFALAVSGCGGDDDSEPLTKAEWLEQADALCTANNEEVDAIGDEVGDTPTDEEFAEGIGRVADSYDDLIDEIKELNPPEEIADDVDAMLASLSDGMDTIRDLGADLRTAEENPLADASAKAQEIGLEVCGS